MKFIYPAVFRSREDGKYEGMFPDLIDCTALGDTLEDAVDAANEAAYNWIMSELEEDDCQMPPVSDISDLSLAEGETARNICVTVRFYEGWDE
ncbi:MAG: type II toxin-antitoxin system HicB family antitoxin [Eubacteriales bacterium]|nr:type II toxin-antitoxin system HicB family antitoxin [Eubacteriales bacterium]